MRKEGPASLAPTMNKNYQGHAATMRYALANGEGGTKSGGMSP